MLPCTSCADFGEEFEEHYQGPLSGSQTLQRVSGWCKHNAWPCPLLSLVVVHMPCCVLVELSALYFPLLSCCEKACCVLRIVKIIMLKLCLYIPSANDSMNYKIPSPNNSMKYCFLVLVSDIIVLGEHFQCCDARGCMCIFVQLISRQACSFLQGLGTGLWTWSLM